MEIWSSISRSIISLMFAPKRMTSTPLNGLESAIKAASEVLEADAKDRKVEIFG